MNGDFSRDTFDPEKYFTRVLMQQGRVQLDSDWNEQVSILLELMRTLAQDLIGEQGGSENGFKIGGLANRNFSIGAGQYYVNGLRCENLHDVKFADLPSWQRPNSEIVNGKDYIVYLDVWERHVTYVEDDDIREKALNGPDTATRGKLVWQVRTLSREILPQADDAIADGFRQWIGPRREAGKLAARSRTGTAGDPSPCEIRSDSRYRGAENQLYRVEIHGAADPGNPESKASWKWSRDNGSVVFPIQSLTTADKTTTVRVEHLGRDDRFGLKRGEWVEIVDDDYVLLGLAHKLLKVSDVRADNLQVILEGTPESKEFDRIKTKHPLLRRWDQRQSSKVDVTANGVINVENDKWFELEDGIEIQFSRGQGNYRTGDFWLIPARVATGDIEWPNPDGNPKPRPPRGINHYYAPLASLAVNGQGLVTAKDLRRIVLPK